MEASVWFWAAFNAAVLALLLLDLGVFARKDANGDPAPVPVRTALLKSGAYFGLAMAFCAFSGPPTGRRRSGRPGRWSS